MKKIKFVFLTIFLIFCLAACATATYNKSYTEETVKRFNNIAIVEPFVEIVEVGNDENVVMEGVSKSIKDKFKKHLASFLNTSHSKYYKQDVWNKEQVEAINDLIGSVYGLDDISNTTIARTIFEDIAEDKIIVNYVKGFVKTNARRRTEFLKTLGIGIATLGFFIPIYPGYNTVLYSVMIDKSDGKVIYKEHISLMHMDPRNSSVIQKVVEKGIVKHFDA